MADFTTKRRNLVHQAVRAEGEPCRCSGYVQRKGAGYIGSHSYKRRFMELYRDHEGLGPVLLIYKRYGGKVVAKTLLDGYDKISMPSGKKSKHEYFEIAHATRTARRFRVEDEGMRNKWMDSISLCVKEHVESMTPELRRRIDVFLSGGDHDKEAEDHDEDEDGAEHGGQGQSDPSGSGSGGLGDLGDLGDAVDGAVDGSDLGDEAASPRRRAQTGEDFEAAHRAMLQARHRERRVRRSFRDRSKTSASEPLDLQPPIPERDTSDVSDDDDDGDWCEWKSYVCEDTGHTYFMNEKGEAYWGPTVLHSASDSPWEARVDNTTGATYYFNVVTEVSQWEMPEDYVPPTESRAQADASSPPLRGEDPPVVVSERAVPDEVGAARELEEQHTPGGSHAAHKHHARPYGLPGLAKKDSHLALPGLPKPCPWEAKFDTTHNAYYYFNAATNESTWTKPDDYVDPS